MAPRSAVLLALVATLSVGADAARMPVRLRARAAIARAASARVCAMLRCCEERCFAMCSRAALMRPRLLPLPDAHVMNGHSARRVRAAQLARALPQR
jgi:hypothetical protein